VSGENQQETRASDLIQKVADSLRKLEDSAIEQGDQGKIEVVKVVGLAMLSSMQSVGQELQKAIAREEKRRGTPSGN